MQTLSCRVAGKPTGSGPLLEVRSPYSGELVGTVTTVGRAEAEAAIAAATSFTATPSKYQRAEILEKTRIALEARRDEFARIITSEAGLALREARYEVGRTVDVLRFAAMEALARAGVRVGVLVAPVIAGLNDAQPQLEALLRKSRSFGASFAGAAPLTMGAEARARLVRHVAQDDPERATRFDRLLARSAEQEAGFTERLSRSFDAACERSGLENVWGPHHSARGGQGEGEEQRGPRQLSLF